MFTFEEFKVEIKEKVQAFFGEDYNVSVRDFPKNNGVILHGLTALHKDSCMSPTIYLEPYYKTYCEGTEIRDIVMNIFEFYEKYKFTGQMNLDFLLDYGQVRTQIFCKLIHYENNRKMLSDVPHKRFLDLAMVCYIHYMNDFMGEGSILVRTGQLDDWGIPEETLFTDARHNMENKMKPEILSMKEIILGMMAKQGGRDTREYREMEEAFRDPEYADFMYVLTHKNGYFGAVSMCDDRIMEKFSKDCHGSFYILPSSIHELILIPDRGIHQKDELKCMVEEVNAGCVMDEERLSDNVYYYDAKLKKVDSCFL